MGQINCHCQYVSGDDVETFKRQPDSLPVLATEQSEPTQIITKMTLRGTYQSLEIPLSEAKKLTVGTTDDCQQHVESHSGTQFKLEVRYRNRCVFIKDCGVGLGVFLMKRKLIKRIGSTEVFLNMQDKWVVLRILNSKQIGYCIYTTEGNDQGLLDHKEEHEIDLGNCKLTLRSDEEGKEYTIRRSDRRQMWVLLGQERRVKARDMLRMGLEIFEVEGVNSYLQSSKITRKY